MDTIKVGKYIQEKRKKQNLTQQDLADKLSITDRAVSKWECGKSLPDASIMLDLCEILDISVNELLTGEDIEMKNYNEQAELNLVELKTQKEVSDRAILRLEVILMTLSILFLFALVLLGSLLDLKMQVRIAIIVPGFVQLLICAFISFRIEQKVGYYECAECNHKFIPTYAQSLFAPHMGRTKHIKCPKCGKKSWCKKVLTK